METWKSLRVKENLTSVGFQPTTSGLDLPMLCRLSYESSRGAGRGTIEVVNRSECARDYLNNLSTNDIDDENISDKCLGTGGRQYCRYMKFPWIITLGVSAVLTTVLAPTRFQYYIYTMDSYTVFSLASLVS